MVENRRGDSAPDPSVAAKLKAYGFTEAEIAGLRNQDFDRPLLQLLEDGYITPLQAKGLAKQVIETKPEIGALKPGPRFPLRSSSSGEVSLLGCSGGGYHWIIEGLNGYREATGFAELPDVGGITTSSCSPRPNRQNGIPMMFFGIYFQGGGADLGIFYDSAVNGWRGFIWTLTDYWDERPYVFRKPQIPYIHVTVPQDNWVRLRLIDSGTWTQVDLVDYWLLGAKRNGSGQHLNREVSLAQHSFNHDSGAYLLNAHWYNVWIYSPTTTSRWLPQHTRSSYAKPVDDQHIDWQPISSNRAILKAEEVENSKQPFLPECHQGFRQYYIPHEIIDIRGHWAEDCIRRFLGFDNFLLGKGVRNHEDVFYYYDQQGRFRPDDPVTRAEWLKFLWMGEPVYGEHPYAIYPPGYVPLLKRHRGVFRDVEKHWVYRKGYIQEALDGGIIFPEDYWNRRFEPDKPITRLEATIVALRVYAASMGPFPPDEEENRPLGVKRRVLGLISIPAPNPFQDLEAVPEWARPHVLTAARLGLIKGKPDGRFDPQGILTRAEAAVLVWRGWLVSRWCEGCRPR